MSEIFIGIDIGGTNIKIGCFDEKLNLLEKTSIPAEVDMGPQNVIDNIAATLENLLKKSSLTLTDVTAVGLGSPGPAKYKEGLLIELANLPKFKNVSIRQMLSDKLGKPVVFDNDANVACWGEYVAGAGKDIKNMVFFTLGTGIGGGIICNGQLVHGCGDNAAELGHTIIYPDGRLCGCGQKGCAEAYASATATARRATEAVKAGRESSLKKLLDQNGRITCKDVYDRMELGDNLATEIVDETSRALALLCVNMLHVIEPEKIVFAGGMIGSGSALLDPIKNYFDKYIWTLKKETVEICFAALGDDAGITGTADLAKNT